MPNDKLFLSLKEAAHLVGMSKEWLRVRVGKKDGPPYRKRGLVYRFPAMAFREWASQFSIK